jgi:subtilase family serine protease
MAAAMSAVLVVPLPASAAQPLTIQVWLKPDIAGATTLADAVATPGSAEYQQYLSPSAYTARFGPTAAQATAVSAWLAGKGLSAEHAGPGRDYVSATGPVSKVQSTFGVKINKYRVAGAVIRSNDRALSMPAALAPDVIGVTGLSSSPAQEIQSAPTCSHYWAQHVHNFRPSYRGLAKGSLPVCGYSAGQIRAAYGASKTYTGKGQTVALTESEAPTAMFQTLTEYAKSNHLPAPKRSRFRQIQSGAGGKCDAAPSHDSALYNDEAEMDSEAVYAMAPDARQLMVVGAGCDEDQALLDAALSVLTGNGGRRPSASIVSNSWQIPEGEVSPRTVHAIDLRAAAEGVGMYFSSGDTPGLTATSADPFAVAVGGTTLGIGARNNRVFETGWSTDSATLDEGKWSDVGISGAGGGASSTYAQPGYQKGVVPASMSRTRIGKRIAAGRTVPDIAADGDPDTGILTGYISSGRYHTQVNAGTSLACPLIAGLVADAQQGRRTGFGFINPLIYRLSGTRAFHDVMPVDKSMPAAESERLYSRGSDQHRRLRLPGTHLYRAGDRQGIRHDDRGGHAERCRIHYWIAPRCALNRAGTARHY